MFPARSAPYDRTHPNHRRHITVRAGLIIIGIVLLAAGLWITLGHGSYKETSTLVQIGSAKVTASHEKALPSWAGVAGIIAGGLLLVGGLIKR